MTIQLDDNSSPRSRRWYQFTLRKFVLLVTLFSMLAVRFWRYREWGRELAAARYESWLQTFDAAPWENEMVKRRRSLDEFDRMYWLPMKVYELTNWERTKEWKASSSTY